MNKLNLIKLHTTKKTEFFSFNFILINLSDLIFKWMAQNLNTRNKKYIKKTFLEKFNVILILFIKNY